MIKQNLMNYSRMAPMKKQIITSLNKKLTKHKFFKIKFKICLYVEIFSCIKR